jgi:hypothetical protein
LDTARTCSAANAARRRLVCPKCESEGVEKRCAKCKRARKYHGRIFHDLRRSAARDLVRAGNPQSVAMSITGHRTISVFLRYDIAADAEMQTRARRLRKRLSIELAENCYSFYYRSIFPRKKASGWSTGSLLVCGS